MWRDDAHLLDMLIWARRAVGYVSTLSLEEFAENTLAQDAVIRCLQVIGEAAGRVSAECRAQHPEIAWPSIVGMRHRLVHEYAQTDLGEVWRTAREDCPILVSQLEPIVPRPGDGAPPAGSEFL